LIPNMDVLGSVLQNIRQIFCNLFFVALPIAIMLSVVIGYLKFGHENFPDVLKRALVASLLLASFPEISSLILDVCDGLADKIDSANNLEAFIRMAQEKSQSYSIAKNVLLLKFDDLIVAVLTFVSFVFLLIARYLSVALYYFNWILLTILSPLMILAYVFPATANITKNLYQGLMEVAAWKIIWAVLSVMLTSIPFSNIYKTEGSYLTIIVMNFIIALSMLKTSKIMKSLVSDGVHGQSDALGIAATAAMIAVPAKAAAARHMTREVLGQAQKFTPNFKNNRK
jgi:hypothetical protein